LDGACSRERVNLVGNPEEMRSLGRWKVNVGFELKNGGEL
jgi:hypothetical protein